MFKVIEKTGNLVKAFGMFGMMLALAATLVASPAPASAARYSGGGVTPGATPTYGKLHVFVSDASTSESLVQAGVLVYDANGKVVAKGETDKTGFFGTDLVTGNYKIQVIAKGYKDFSQGATINPRSVASIKAALQPDPAPSILPLPIIVP
jgi:hypothetical protein